MIVAQRFNRWVAKLEQKSPGGTTELGAINGTKPCKAKMEVAEELVEASEIRTKNCYTGGVHEY